MLAKCHCRVPGVAIETCAEGGHTKRPQPHFHLKSVELWVTACKQHNQQHSRTGVSKLGHHHPDDGSTTLSLLLTLGTVELATLVADVHDIAISSVRTG